MITDGIIAEDQNLFNNKWVQSDFGLNKTVVKVSTSEDYRNFDEYIERLGLADESNLLVLSSMHHYYYDAEEMVNLKTVINLKELNQIKELKDFLHSMFHILPAGCNFVGCFVNNKKQSSFGLNKDQDILYNKKNSEAIENGIESSYPFLNMVYKMIDSRTNKYLSEKSVSQIFREHGFKITDITEIKSLTYFCAIRLRSADK
jgi:hypothetical protein